jgi:uncharacterized membrane protein (UPF0127 family)
MVFYRLARVMWRLNSAHGIRILRTMKWFAFILAALVAVGCNQQPAQLTTSASATNAIQVPALPTQAQPRLQTLKLWMGAEEVTAELALTGEQQMTGMMFRTNMEENSGMLFVFQGPFRASFWMKNCPLPLSAAYIDPSGRIMEVVHMNAQDTNAIVAKTADVQYVLEMNEGWFARHHIPEGTLIRTERGSLAETFFAR